MSKPIPYKLDGRKDYLCYILTRGEMKKKSNGEYPEIILMRRSEDEINKKTHRIKERW